MVSSSPLSALPAHAEVAQLPTSSASSKAREGPALGPEARSLLGQGAEGWGVLVGEGAKGCGVAAAAKPGVVRMDGQCGLAEE